MATQLQRMHLIWLVFLGFIVIAGGIMLAISLTEGTKREPEPSNGAPAITVSRIELASSGS